jgi:hypothetical protein
MQTILASLSRKLAAVAVAAGSVLAASPAMAAFPDKPLKIIGTEHRESVMAFLAKAATKG